MKIKAKGDIYIDENQSLEILCGQAKLFQAWWNTHPDIGKTQFTTGVYAA